MTDYYEIAVQQFQQEIVPGKQTTVWSYLSLADPAGTRNYPAFTIEARHNRPVRVKWVNDLVDSSGNFLPHLLPVDQTLHWANPPGGLAGRDDRGTDSTPYRGPVPIVTHVHGAHTTDDSDGYAEAWYLPVANNTPADFAKVGTWYETYAIARLFIDLFLDAHAKAPKQIVLDLDATDDPLHGHQEGRFFHGYYDCYCYLPLYVFCGRHLLAAKLRRSNIDASAGAKEEVARIAGQIRSRWPRVRILLRADSAFAREDLMTWCEANRVDYVFGLARNDRLVVAIAAEMADAAANCHATGRPARRFRDFLWSTLDSWSRRRRVIAKAEALPLGDNPRFIVTSLTPAEADARALYERVYCGRGEMENRIKECQLDLFADRTSTRTMRSNQLRLWFASMAYVLLCALRRIGLAHTQFAQATCGTIRLQLLKIGALVRISVRRVKVAMASGFPHQHEFALAHALLGNAGC